MIYNDSGKSLSVISYFDDDGVEKIINKIYKALGDGTLRLIWIKDAYLIVTPKTIVWAYPDFEQDITVKSNTDWINF